MIVGQWSRALRTPEELERVAYLRGDYQAAEAFFEFSLEEERNEAASELQSDLTEREQELASAVKRVEFLERTVELTLKALREGKGYTLETRTKLADALEDAVDDHQDAEKLEAEMQAVVQWPVPKPVKPAKLKTIQHRANYRVAN